MANIVDITSGSWKAEVVEADLPVVVNFWGPSCVWCRRLDPLYEEMAEAYEGKLKFAKLNVATGQEVAMQHGIMGTPTLKFFCRGRPVHEIVGFRPRDQLRGEIQRALETANDCIDQSTPMIA